MTKEREGYEMRCLRCLQGRMVVPWGQAQMTCPYCGQDWRITWVTPKVAKIRGKVLTKEASRGKNSIR